MKKKRQSVFSKLNPYMGNKKVFIPLAVVLSGITAVINMIPFYYIWRISREIFNDSGTVSVDKITHYAVLILVFAITGIVMYFFSLMLSHLAAFEVELGIKKEGFKKAMYMPLGFFNTQSSGKMRKIISDGAAQTHTFLAHQLPDLAGSIITPLMVVIVFLVFDWRLGLAALVPIASSFVMMSMMMSESGKLFQSKYLTALEEMSSESVEYVRAIPVVKTFGQSVKSFTKFYNSINNYKELVMMYTKMWAKPYSGYVVFVESTAFFLVPIAILLIGNEASFGEILSDFILYIIVAPLIGLTMMRSAYFSQQKNIAEQAIDRFNELFEYNKLEYPEKGVEFKGQDIEFKNVSFSYDGEKNVLDNINFRVAKGETLALVGASGGGKTTIARLAARFWDTKEGEVIIGGHNIKEYTKKELMENISFVFQNNQLFKTTLRENITFGRDDITEEDIESALQKSRAKEIIDNLSEGLDTMIGKKGTYLSGGEQQRIALARAFIKDAPIILLDEATAFADPENEHLIQSALKELSKGKTTIMIAHRMNTVKGADHIAVIDQGKVSEYGTHDELMKLDGMYKSMWDEYKTSISWNIKKGVE